MKLVAPLDANRYEILNAIVQVLAIAPTNPAPSPGQIYYDSTINSLRFWDGTEWVNAATTGSGQGASSLSGEATGLISGTNIQVTLNNSAVVAKLLTSLDTNLTGDVTAADSILAAFGRLQNRIANTTAKTGTPNQTFQIGTGGPLLKNNGGVMEVRNPGDTDYADLTVKNLIIKGTTTQVDSTIVNIGDNQIVLNDQVAAAASNSDGGIAVKRLASDNTTRRDAALNFNTTLLRWEALFGPTSAAPIAKRIALLHVESVGNGSSTVFAITHNLNNPSPVTQVFESVSPYQKVEPRVENTSANVVTITFGTAPTNNQFNVSIVG
jgi:hypothetical protein